MLFLIAAWGLAAAIAGVALWPGARRAVEAVAAKTEPIGSSDGGVALALVRWVPFRYRPTALGIAPRSCVLALGCPYARAYARWQ
jgi:hypothetical protein